MIAAGHELPPEPQDQHAVANIQYTSGTTGAPKGAMLTHRNLVNNARSMGHCLKATHEDRICAPVPLYHCFGSVIASMVSVTTGAALILPSAQFDALATLKAIHEERATAVYGVPTMFIAELEHPEFPRFDLRSLRTGVMAGSPCPIEIMRRVVDEMHCRELTIVYGQTESSPGITQSRADDSLELRVTTVGCALPNTEVKIVDVKTREIVPVGVQGELCTRGYLVMKGYDQDAKATSEAIDEEGWLHTGDLANMQPNGYFRMRGRAKETIIRGGENIYPREVEEFLSTHPKVLDVYVVGVPDRRLGETVAAWIRIKEGQQATEDEIRNFCRGRIAYFKVPQYIRFVDSFPMTVTNKVQKYLIREEEIRARGLAEAAGIQTA
jgi:fatty-acyl-CoA synthase